MSIIRFEDVDVIFSNKPREALALLDKGQTREQILKQTGLVVGVEKANLDIQKVWKEQAAREAEDSPVEEDKKSLLGSLKSLLGGGR